jgi:type IV fimbrial biogenesis protein FimT
MNTTTTSSSFSTLCRMTRLLPRRPAHGFTLVETMAVVAVIAVLAAIAAPSITAMMKSVKLSSASNVFLAGLHLARGEAIKRNSRVVLCKSADGAACTPDGGWEQGWIIFHDANNNGVRDGAEKLVQREYPLSASLRLTGNSNVARYVSFAPTGATKLVGGGFQAGTLTLCNQSAQSSEARQIVLNAVGRPRVHKASVPSCA